MTVTWNFGDGNSTSAALDEPVTHTYAEPGTFTVTATKPDGRSADTEVAAGHVFPTIVVPLLGGEQLFSEFMEVGFVTWPAHPLRSGMGGFIAPLNRPFPVGAVITGDDLMSALITTANRPYVATMFVAIDGGESALLQPDSNGIFVAFLPIFELGEHTVTFTLRDAQEETIGSGTLRFTSVPLGTLHLDSVEPDSFTVTGLTLSEDLIVTIRGSDFPSSLVSYSLRNGTSLEHAAAAEVVSESEVVATLLPAGQWVGEPGTTNWQLGLASNDAAGSLPFITVTVTQ
jgi:hypothetical protein